MIGRADRPIRRTAGTPAEGEALDLGHVDAPLIPGPSRPRLCGVSLALGAKLGIRFTSRSLDFMMPQMRFWLAPRRSTQRRCAQRSERKPGSALRLMRENTGCLFYAASGADAGSSQTPSPSRSSPSPDRPG